MNPMKDALSKRKGKGLDIAIMVGGDKKDDSSSDLAPKGASDPAHASPAPSEMGEEKGEVDKLTQLMGMLKDKPEALNLVHQIIQDQSMEAPEPQEPSAMDKESFGNALMDGADKNDLASRTKPRSLLERARMDQLKK